jgi:hypothetical protein
MQNSHPATNDFSRRERLAAVMIPTLVFLAAAVLLLAVVLMSRD